jgi:hypothetical protein
MAVIGMVPLGWNLIPKMRSLMAAKPASEARRSLAVSGDKSAPTPWICSIITVQFSSVQFAYRSHR